MQADAALPPSGRDNVGLDRVALNAVEGIPFVVLVQDADQQQEQAGKGVLTVAQVVWPGSLATNSARKASRC